MAILLGFGSLKAQSLAMSLNIMPDAMIPNLKTETKKALIETALRDGGNAETRSMLGGIIKIKSLSENYAEIETSKYSQMTVQKMRCDTTEMLMVISTVTVSGTQDSKLEFFSPTWTPLKKEMMTLSINDFYVENDSIPLDVVKNFCKPFMYSLSASGDTLQAKFSPQDYLPKEYYEKVKGAISSEKVTKIWNGKTFTSCDNHR